MCVDVCERAEVADCVLVELRKNLGLEGVELINLCFGKGRREEMQNLCQEAHCFGKVCNFMQIEKISYFLLRSAGR